MLSQKEAVYQATKAVLQQHNTQFRDGDNIRDIIGNDIDLRREVRDLVHDALMSGKVALGENRRNDESTMRAYATGLISNWWRKDRRLNGGERYTPIGSRVGTQVRYASSISGPGEDDRVRRLRDAIEVADNDELRQALQNAIDEREDELRTEKDLAEEVREGRYNNGMDPDDINNDRPGLKRADAPPSLGSGHRGAVTDPEHDMRLRRNETPELHEARVEAGRRGGETVARERGSEFYSQIGQKGGLSRGGQGSQTRESTERPAGEEAEDLFRDLLKRRSA